MSQEEDPRTVTDLLDQHVLTGLSAAWSRKMTRRVFADHLAKLLLRAAGVTALTALPIAQEFAGTAAAVNCASTRYCGLTGHPCSCCGGTDTSCPSGSSPRGWWSQCCGSYEYTYQDCCSNISNHSCQAGCSCNNPTASHVYPNQFCEGWRYLWCTMSIANNVCCLGPNC